MSHSHNIWTEPLGDNNATSFTQEPSFMCILYHQLPQLTKGVADTHLDAESPPALQEKAHQLVSPFRLLFCCLQYVSIQEWCFHPRVVLLTLVVVQSPLVVRLLLAVIIQMAQKLR